MQGSIPPIESLKPLPLQRSKPLFDHIRELKEAIQRNRRRLQSVHIGYDERQRLEAEVALDVELLERFTGLPLHVTPGVVSSALVVQRVDD